MKCSMQGLGALLALLIPKSWPYSIPGCFCSLPEFPVLFHPFPAPGDLCNSSFFISHLTLIRGSWRQRIPFNPLVLTFTWTPRPGLNPFFYIFKHSGDFPQNSVTATALRCVCSLKGCSKTNWDSWASVWEPLKLCGGFPESFSSSGSSGQGALGVEWSFSKSKVSFWVHLILYF